MRILIIPIALILSLIAAVDVNASTSTYIYDSSGQRIKKSTTTGTIIYHYDNAGQVLCESDEKGEIQRSFIYANGQRIAEVKAEGSIMIFHNNELGTPIAITDDQGNITQRYIHEPFGNIVVSKGSGENNFTFTGKERDAESGLFYFGARYYDPIIGRFISKDPANIKKEDPQTLNRYVFCLNNPLKYVDPDGEDAILYVDRDQAFRQGHMGLYFQDIAGGWWKSDLSPQNVLKDMFGGLGNYNVAYKPFFDPTAEMTRRSGSALYMNTDKQQDRIIYEYVMSVRDKFISGSERYNLLYNNCKDITYNALAAGGIGVPQRGYLFYQNDPRPNTAFDNINYGSSFGGIAPSWDIWDAYDRMWAGNNYSWPSLGAINF